MVCGGFNFNSILCGQSAFHLCRPHPTTLYEGQENLRFWNAIGGKEKYYTEKRKEVSLCLGSISKEVKYEYQNHWVKVK